MAKKNSADNLFTEYIEYNLRGNGNSMLNIGRVVAEVYSVLKYDFVCCFVWVWNLVVDCHINRSA